MANKQQVMDTLIKMSAAARIFVAVVRVITLFQDKGKIQEVMEIQDEVAIKRVSENRFVRNLPKIMAITGVFLTIIRFIRLFRGKAERVSEHIG